MYEGIGVDWERGAEPTAHFFDQFGYEMEKAVMSDLTKEQIAAFFAAHGLPLRRRRVPYGNVTSAWSWGGHHYELFTQQNAFSFAEEFAASRTHGGAPGYVAAASSSEEQRVIAQMMEKSGVESVWLGGGDGEEEGAWKWRNGELRGQAMVTEGGFVSWNAGEPNDAGDEDCVVLVKAKSRIPRYGWNDVSCTMEVSALVVEFGAQPHDSSPLLESSSSSPSSSSSSSSSSTFEDGVDEKKAEL